MLVCLMWLKPHLHCASYNFFIHNLGIIIFVDKLKKEIDSFQNIWHGGYRTGYSKKRGQDRLEDYLAKNLQGSSFLEIGPGGGQWTKFVYNLNLFEKIYCIDVLSAEHNKFWENLGTESKNSIEYLQAFDFKLSEIPNNSIDFVFSYDVFCHTSLSTLEQYLDSLFKKCKQNARLLIMYADPKKYLSSEPENKYHVVTYLPENKFIYKFSNKYLIEDALTDSNAEPSEGRWYWIGKSSFTELVKSKGFNIVNEDINTDKTNVITLFIKS